MYSPPFQLDRLTNFVLHFAFVLTGVVTTMLGPLLPSLSMQWQLSDAQAGALVTVQFISAMAATLLSNRIAARLGTKRTLVVSLSLMTVGVVGVSSSHWSLGLMSVCGYGIGLGLIVPTMNLLVAELHPTRRAAALNVLNFAWSFGAISSAPLITLLLRGVNVTRPLFAIAGLLLLTLLALWRRNLPVKMAQHPSLDSALPRSWTNPTVWIVGALAFLYGGTETPLASWIASYTLRLNESHIEMKAFWAMTPSLFWAALMGGRLLAPLLFRVRAEGQVILAGLVIASVGMIALFFAARPFVLLTSVPLIGLGLAPFFPTTVALFPRYFDSAAAKVAPFR